MPAASSLQLLLPAFLLPPRHHCGPLLHTPVRALVAVAKMISFENSSNSIYAELLPLIRLLGLCVQSHISILKISCESMAYFYTSDRYRDFQDRDFQDDPGRMRGNKRSIESAVFKFIR